jgi:hypothetical protein
MAITNFQQAMAFANSDVGKKMPLFRLVDDAKYYFRGTGSRSRERGKEQARIIASFERARQDPVEFTKRAINQAVTDYSRSYRAYQSDPHPQIKSELDGFKNDLAKAVNFLVENKVPASEIQNIFTTAEQFYQDLVKKSNALASKQNFFDKLFSFSDALIVGGLTGGLGLSAVNAAALNSALAIANGAPIDKALQAGLAGLAANQVGSYLQTVNAIAQNDLVNSAVTNASRQATAALITGGDVKTAALAGLAGGATAQQLLRATDSEAISRAAGEYTQAMAAGQSPTQAMMLALSGFAETELQDAKRNIEAEANAQQARKAAPPPTPDVDVPPTATAGTTTKPPTGSSALPEVTVTGSKLPDVLGTKLSVTPSQITRPAPPPTAVPSLPPVEVTAAKPDEIIGEKLSTPKADTGRLPEVTVTGTPELPAVEVTGTKPDEIIGEKLSTPKATPEDKTTKTAEEPETARRRAILLSLLGPASSTYYLGDRGAGGGGGGMPSSAALSQALSVGDPGALYLGKKGKERRPVWNVESLKLKDELGGDYG